MQQSMIQQIDEVVKLGKLVVTADNETAIAIVKATILNDLTASFYLTRQQADAVKAWFWTPERIKITGLKPISYEEETKIKTELGIRNIHNFRYAPFLCGCGRAYGAFEFFQQGLHEHGLQMINAVFSLQNSTFFQVNPSFVPICPDCGQAHRMRNGGGEYDCDEYGGCCCCANLVNQSSTKASAP